jgi:hypothetical protein
MTPSITNARGGKSPPPLIFANNREGITPHTLQRYGYIPLDYIRGEVVNINTDNLLNHLTTQWSESKFRTHFKGEESIKTIFRHENVQLDFHASGRALFSGSLHTYSNGGKHNFDQFNLGKFNSSIEKMKRELSIKPEDIRLTCLEYGVNITPPIPTSEILTRCFQHQRSHFEEVISRPEGKYHRATHDAYQLKLYDKSLQYKLSEQLLRIEVKTTNWSSNRRKGIITLDDFIKADKTPFVHDLINRWNEVLFVDPTTHFADPWHKYTNREYWRELRKGSRSTFNRHLNSLRSQSNEGTQALISSEIKRTISQLQNDTNTIFI